MDNQSAVIALLSGLEGGAMRRVDTHGACVFLGATLAYKLKRSVDLGYMDFSSAAKRHAALMAELTLNRRTAPELYLGLRPVLRAADGALRLGAPGEEGAAVDWVLEMRRFDDGALLAEVAERGGLDRALLLRLADAVARFHGLAEVVAVADAAARLGAVIAGNARAMAALPTDALPAPACADLTRRSEAALAAHAALLDERGRTGHIRRCHGDLHLGNICLWRGEPTLFDALEFDERLATIDVLYDLAFLVMDLWERGYRAEASLVWNRWLDLCPGEAGGLPAMGLFLSQRAAIRAHVGALAPGEAARAAARAYLDAALMFLTPATPRLVAVGGLSGTGKSTLAGGLAPGIGAAPGARWLRSDVIRKRLAGVVPEQRLPPESYTKEASAAVYAALLDQARTHLAMGVPVVVDAVFAAPAERAAMADLARGMGVPFVGLWLETDRAVMVARVSARSGDASDADAVVAQRQLAYDLGDIAPWRRIDAGGSPAEVLAAALAVLNEGA